MKKLLFYSSPQLVWVRPWVKDFTQQLEASTSPYTAFNYKNHGEGLFNLKITLFFYCSQQ